MTGYVLGRLFAAIPVLYGAVRIWLALDHTPPASHGTIAGAAGGESE